MKKSKRFYLSLAAGLLLAGALSLSLGACSRDFDPSITGPEIAERSEGYDPELDEELLTPPPDAQVYIPQRTIYAVTGAPTSGRAAIEMARDVAMDAWYLRNDTYVCSADRLLSSFDDLCWNYMLVYSRDQSVNAGLISSISIHNKTRWFDQQDPCKVNNGASFVSCGSMAPAHDFKPAYNLGCPMNGQYWYGIFDYLLNGASLGAYWNEQIGGWNVLKVQYDGDYLFSYRWPIDTVPSFYCSPPTRGGKGDGLPEIMDAEEPDGPYRPVPRPEGGGGE